MEEAAAVQLHGLVFFVEGAGARHRQRRGLSGARARAGIEGREGRRRRRRGREETDGAGREYKRASKIVQGDTNTI